MGPYSMDLRGDCSIIAGQFDPETCHWAWKMSHRQGVGTDLAF